jgi:hypothetical protein
MRGRFRWKVGAGLLAAIAAGAAMYVAVFSTSRPVTYVTPDLVPISLDLTSRGAYRPPAELPAHVSLPVPYTSQAPLGNWAQRQHTCEEASLLMVDLYLGGNHSGAPIDPRTADAGINRITAWKPAVDLTPAQVGQVAQKHMGWTYQILPADRPHMRQELALGLPLIIGVRTHGLGNPNYPGYYTHHEQAGWSVSHYLVVTGYGTSDDFILNDPGITRGHGYHITYDQLMHAIDDLDQAYPNLNAGRVFLVLAPASTVS